MCVWVRLVYVFIPLKVCQLEIKLIDTYKKKKIYIYGFPFLHTVTLVQRTTTKLKIAAVMKANLEHLATAALTRTDTSPDHSCMATQIIYHGNYSKL